jgi:hypothetical protein
MKAKLFFLIIFTESIIILILTASSLKKEFDIFINDPTPHSLRIVNNELWAEISLSEQGELNSVSIVNGDKRIIHVTYSENGITNYVISDYKANYKIENVFYNNLSDNEIIGSINDIDNLNNDNAEYIVRREKYKSKEWQYRINYNETPYFFDIE